MDAKKRITICTAALFIICATIFSGFTALILYQQDFYGKANSVLQLSNEFKSQAARLYIIENEINRQIRYDNPTTPRGTFQGIYAAEEIEFIRQWYTCLIGSPRFEQLEESLKQIVIDIAQPLSTLQNSFKNLERKKITSREERNAIIDDEIDPSIRHIISLCNDFAGQGSQNFNIRYRSPYSFEKFTMQIMTVFTLAGITSFAFFFFIIRNLNDKK